MAFYSSFTISHNVTVVKHAQYRTLKPRTLNGIQSLLIILFICAFPTVRNVLHEKKGPLVIESRSPLEST